MGTLLYYFLYALFYIPSRIFLPARVINKKNRPKKGAILACNHLSAIDPIAIGMYTTRKMHFFTKKELSKNWFFRIMIPAVGSFFVERGKADIGAVKKSLKILNDGKVLMIFPEGHRNMDSDVIQELKAGAVTFAIKTDTRVIPVIIWRRPKACRRNFIYYGEPISFSQYKDVKMTQEDKRAATMILTQKMAAAQEELRAYLLSKRPRLLKRYERNLKLKTEN